MIKNYIIPAFLTLILSLILPDSQLIAQKNNWQVPGKFPYELKTEQEMGLMITGTGLLYASAYGHNNKTAWGKAPLTKLDPKDLWLPDRLAVNNWRPGLNDLREFFEPALSIGSFGLIGAYGIASYTQKKHWSELMTLSMMYMEGLYISAGGELLAKVLFNRARPYTYNTDLPLEERIRPGNNESFFSGNATVLFYNAAFLSLLSWEIYPDSKWTPYIIGGSFAIAELSAIWSVRSGMHFPTDVITGALWGSGVAYFIHRIHKKGARGLNVMPWIIDKGQGLILKYRISYKP